MAACGRPRAPGGSPVQRALMGWSLQLCLFQTTGMPTLQFRHRVALGVALRGTAGPQTTSFCIIGYFFRAVKGQFWSFCAPFAFLGPFDHCWLEMSNRVKRPTVPRSAIRSHATPTLRGGHPLGPSIILLKKKLKKP